MSTCVSLPKPLPTRLRTRLPASVLALLLSFALPACGAESSGGAERRSSALPPPRISSMATCDIASSRGAHEVPPWTLFCDANKSAASSHRERSLRLTPGRDHREGHEGRIRTPTSSVEPIPAKQAGTRSTNTMRTHRLRMLILTDLEGYLEPCGCRSEALGGLARLAATRDALLKTLVKATAPGGKGKARNGKVGRRNHVGLQKQEGHQDQGARDASTRKATTARNNLPARHNLLAPQSLPAAEVNEAERPQHLTFVVGRTFEHPDTVGSAPVTAAAGEKPTWSGQQRAWSRQAREQHLHAIFAHWQVDQVASLDGSALAESGGNARNATHATWTIPGNPPLHIETRMLPARPRRQMDPNRVDTSMPPTPPTQGHDATATAPDTANSNISNPNTAGSRAIRDPGAASRAPKTVIGTVGSERERAQAPGEHAEETDAGPSHAESIFEIIARSPSPDGSEQRTTWRVTLGQDRDDPAPPSIEGPVHTIKAGRHGRGWLIIDLWDVHPASQPPREDFDVDDRITAETHARDGSLASRAGGKSKSPRAEIDAGKTARGVGLRHEGLPHGAFVNRSPWSWFEARNTLRSQLLRTEALVARSTPRTPSVEASSSSAKFRPKPRPKPSPDAERAASKDAGSARILRTLQAASRASLHRARRRTTQALQALEQEERSTRNQGHFEAWYRAVPAEGKVDQWTKAHVEAFHAALRARMQAGTQKAVASPSSRSAATHTARGPSPQGKGSPSSKALPVKQSADEAVTYVGSARCENCHAIATRLWSATPHANAWSTLRKRQKELHFECVGCHVTGFEEPGGWSMQDVVHGQSRGLENVGCESCHGPGAAHVAQPLRHPMRAGDGRETCTGCHNSVHSDQFVYDTYMRKIVVPGHGLSLSAP